MIIISHNILNQSTTKRKKMSIHSAIKLPCGLSLQNRVAKAAMTESLANPADNAPNAQHVQLYKTWGEIGAGMLITGNIMVDPRYLECPGNIVVDSDKHLPTLKEMAKYAKAHGSALFAQVSHPGRQCPISVTSEPVCPSACPPVKQALPLFAKSRALTVPEIESIVQRFAKTARIIQDAGFDGVQIHAAHGYLLSQFLSPSINKRTDEYGGSPQRRYRILRDVIREVRAATRVDKSKISTNFAVAVKLNSEDFNKAGLSCDESYEVVEMLIAEHVDIIEISGGTYENIAFFQQQKDRASHKQQHHQDMQEIKESTLRREAFFIDYVSNMRENVRAFQKSSRNDMSSGSSSSSSRVLPAIMLTGGFRSTAGMNDAVASGDVDIIGMARPFAIQPQELRALLASSSTFRGTAAAAATATTTTKEWNNKKEKKEDFQLQYPKINLSIAPHLNSGLENMWYQGQIELLSLGKEPNLNLGYFRALTTQVISAYIWSPSRTTVFGWVKLVLSILVIIFALCV